MDELLNNTEIDALLQAFRSEGANEDGETPQPSLVGGAAGSTIAPMDLLKPNRVGREELRGLARCFESAAKLLTATMSEKLRLDARCDCVAIEQMRFSAWLEQLPGPVAIYALEMQPFKQPVLLTASTGMLYGAVDRILGGSGKVTKVPKDFTAAEYTVADALLGPCLDRICESLAEVVPLKWSVTNRFCNPSMAQVLPSHDVVLSVYFQTASELLLGDLRLLLPFTALEPLLERFTRDARTGPEPGDLRAQVERAVRVVPMEVSAQLGEARIRLRQLLELQAGDVIPLETRFGQPAVVPVQGKPKFTAHVGKIGNRLGVQIADLLPG